MISFELSDEQKILKETLAAFAEEQIRPASRDADEEGRVPDALVAKAWELGLVQSAIPSEFGGYDDEPSAVTGAIVVEDLAWGDLSIALHVLAPRLLTYPLLAHGTDAQKAAHLPRFAGEPFTPGSAAVVEPSMGFDPSHLQTTFRADGDAFVLNGRKAFAPLAGASETILIYARDESAAVSADDPATGYAAVQGFLVPRETAGLEVHEREKNMGLKALETHELTMTELRLGADAKLGGAAGIDFARLMNRSRIALGAMAVGVARAASEYAREYAKERQAFGVPIAQKQAIAFMLAEMAIEIDAARLLVWEAAWKLDRGEDAMREAYLAKNYAADMALSVTDNAVQVLGGHGYIRDHLVELWLRNARGFVSFEGLAIV